MSKEVIQTLSFNQLRMKYLGYIGLGKMGLNMALRLKEKQYEVVAFNRSEEPRKSAEEAGVVVTSSIKEMVDQLEAPRTVWLMVPHSAVDEVLAQVVPLLSEGDTVIEGGNSYFKESVRRAGELKAKGINFLDAGVSGGPRGAREGACVMVGGEKEVYDAHEELFQAISAEEAYGYMGGPGAGHYVKMVHNGIEYGMMQAIAEGFAVMRKSEYNFDLQEIARVYNHRSVIESRLVEWLRGGFETYGVELVEMSGSPAHSGEGEWTVKTAEELGVPVPIIKGSYEFRVQSKDDPSYTGKVVSVLRNQFGGHSPLGQDDPTNK